MKRKLIALFFVAALVRVVLAFLVWHPDLNNHLDWGIRFWQYGPAKFYSANVWSFTWPNQPPGTIYLFAGVRKLFEFLFSVLWLINIKIPAFPSIIVSYAEINLYPALLKLPGILSDLGIGWLVFKIIRKVTQKERLALIGAAVWLFNPVSWYNSAVWGQYDAVINFLALFAFYLLTEKKLVWAILLLGLSIYTKASLLIFGPIFLIIAVRQKYNLLSWIKAVAVTLMVIGLITLPFSKGELFSWLFNLYKDKVFTQQLQIITANAFNIWAAMTGISEQFQTLPFLGLTYQYWGYILFSVFYLPCLWLVYRKRDIESVVWVLAVASFASFMLLTNMHERYLYSLFPYFTILLIMHLNLIWNYTAVSIINILNLYNFWWVPVIPGLVVFMSAYNRLAPRVLGGIGFVLFLLFYVRFFKNIGSKIY
jgi:Gpi18-like mannosyltransferase